MELTEVVEKRNVLEIEIRDFISKKCKKFEKETGLYLSSINIDTITLSEIGQPKDSLDISGCTIKVHI